MFSMARPVQHRTGVKTLLPILATVTLLALLGHFVADAGNLWPNATPSVASNSGFRHESGARHDAASTLHTGFAVAIHLTIATPLVLSVLQVSAFPHLVLRRFSPPLLPPKAS
jgi:hypothetical protein